MRSLGYPRRRKNGGHSEAGAAVQVHRTASHERSPALRGGAAEGEAPRPNTSFAPLGYPRWEMPRGHEEFRVTRCTETGGIFSLIPSGSMLYVYYYTYTAT